MTLPDFIAPQLAVPGSTPEGTHWLHEIKFDGYRLATRVQHGDVRLLTRGRQDWTHRFPEVAAALVELPIRQAYLDGEIVSLLPSGVSSFGRLQTAFQEQRTSELVYQVFDLLLEDGEDLRAEPLIERKKRLQAVLEPVAGNRIRYTDHVQGAGPQFYRQACDLGLEGVVSKRVDKPYRSGRDASWIKAKQTRRETFLIGGFTPPSGSRRGLGALLLGFIDGDGNLIYAGKAGTGFSEAQLVSLTDRLEAMTQSRSPFSSGRDRRIERNARWVRPELQATVEFHEWSKDGLLRHPVFVGLAEPSHKRGGSMTDPDANSNLRGHAVMALSHDQQEILSKIRFTNPDRVLYPQSGETKLDVARYYVTVAERMLPHLADRPISLVRCPGGIEQECFYQKHSVDGFPDEVRRAIAPYKDFDQPTLIIDDLQALVSVVQMGTIEIHPWGCRLDRPERPDRLIFDLDPDEKLSWTRVVEAAFLVRERLDKLGLVSFVKTTGGKGLHVVAPLTRRREWEPVKEFARRFASTLAGEFPAQYTAVSTKAKRVNRIYIDYLRNGLGSTSVAPYSVRARPRATVSWPVAWADLAESRRRPEFRLATVSLGSTDPWDGIFEVNQSITAAAERAVGV